MKGFLMSIKDFCVNLYQREKTKKNPLLMLIHPIDTVEEMKEKRNGSVFWATVILFLFTVSEVIVTVAKGFLFSSAKLEDFNLFYVLLRSCLLVLLFVVGNWSLCTLLSGEGRMIDIYIYTCYSISPMIVYKVLEAALSNVITTDEYVFVSMLYTCVLLWCGCMLVFAMKRLHNYNMSKTIWSMLLTIVAMAVIFFLIYLFFTLLQQLWTFIMTIYTEIVMRTQA